MLPDFMECLAGVFIGNGCCCCRLSNWDGLWEGGFKEGWDFRGQGDHSSFPAPEFGSRLERLDLRRYRRGVRSLREDCLWDPEAMWAEGREGCRCCSVAALGRRQQFGLGHGVGVVVVVVMGCSAYILFLVKVT